METEESICLKTSGIFGAAQFLTSPTSLKGKKIMLECYNLQYHLAILKFLKHTNELQEAENLRFCFLTVLRLPLTT